MKTSRKTIPVALSVLIFLLTPGLAAGLAAAAESLRGPSPSPSRWVVVRRTPAQLRALGPHASKTTWRVVAAPAGGSGLWLPTPVISRPEALAPAQTEIPKQADLQLDAAGSAAAMPSEADPLAVKDGLDKVFTLESAYDWWLANSAE